MRILPNGARMDTLGLDTIAGAKLLQLRFGAAGAFQPDQAVMHGDRRARFVRVSDGAAIIQHWGSSRRVAVPLESLSVPLEQQHSRTPPSTAGSVGRPSGSAVARFRLEVPQGGWLPRHQPRWRPVLRP
jgi:hypothetical protein